MATGCAAASARLRLSPMLPLAKAVTVARAAAETAERPQNCNSHRVQNMLRVSLCVSRPLTSRQPRRHKVAVPDLYGGSSVAPRWLAGESDFDSVDPSRVISVGGSRAGSSRPGALQRAGEPDSR